MGKRPLDVLHAALGTNVNVELRGGRQVRGVLDGYDQPHLNLVVKNAEEVVDGSVVARSSKMVLRGDSVLWVVP